MPAIYFLAGAVSVILAALIVETRKKPKRQMPRGYLKIDTMRWHLDFDYDVAGLTGAQVGYIMLNVAHQKMFAEMKNFDRKIEPGHYSIRFDMAAAFTKRAKGK